jgi:PD-(D/E)XK endonuclease
MEKPQALPLPRRPATNQRHALPPKRRGEIAELAFMQKAVSLGFGVAKPWGDSDRYDYILDAGRRFWRVQVEAFCGRERSGSPQPKSRACRGISPAPPPTRAIADTLSIPTFT